MSENPDLQIEEYDLPKFKEAGEKAKQKEIEAEEEAETSGGKITTNISEYHMATSVNWLPLNQDREVVFTPLGLPYLSRTKPWHPKKIFTRKLICDSGALMPIVYKQLKDANGVDQNIIDETWILSRLLQKVSDKVWDKTLSPPENAQKHYDGWWRQFHAGTEIFKMLDYNKPNDKFKNPSAFSNPNEMVLIQVISRMDSTNYDTGYVSFLTNSYTVTTKEDKDKKKNEKGEIITYKNYYVSYGIYESLYQDILNHGYSKYGHWAFDHILNKHKVKEKYVTSINTAMDENLSREVQLRIVPPLKEYDMEVVNGREIKTLRVSPTPLSAEDKKLKVYDADKLFAHTSYADLFNFYAHEFLLCDKELNTTFYDELVEEVKVETGSYPTDSKYKRSRIKEKYDLDSKVLITKDQELPKQVETSEAPDLPKLREEVAPVAEPVVSIDTITDPEQIRENCKKVYPFFEEMPKPEQDLMVSDIESFSNGLPVYRTAKSVSCECKKTFVDIYGNQTDKQVKVHTETSMCAECGIQF